MTWISSGALLCKLYAYLPLVWMILIVVQLFESFDTLVNFSISSHVNLLPKTAIRTRGCSLIIDLNFDPPIQSRCQSLHRNYRNTFRHVLSAGHWRRRNHSWIRYSYQNSTNNGIQVSQGYNDHDTCSPSYHAYKIISWRQEQMFQ